MANYRYVLIRLCPDERRGELVNVGVVVIGAGNVDVRVLRSLARVEVLHPSFDTTSIRELPRELSKAFEMMDDRDLEDPFKYGAFELSGGGSFSIVGPEQYGKAVDELERKFVSTPLRPRPRGRTIQTKLLAEIKSIFKKEGVLESDATAIERHKVVQKYPIDPESNLFADFALKNGHYRFTEVLDFRVTTGISTTKMGQAAVSALTLDQALHHYDGCKRHVVYAADRRSEKQIAGHLNMLSNYTDEIFNFESKMERAEYVNGVLGAAGSNLSLEHLS